MVGGTGDENRRSHTHHKPQLPHVLLQFAVHVEGSRPALYWPAAAGIMPRSWTGRERDLRSQLTLPQGGTARHHCTASKLGSRWGQ